jgi:hypothetical protein
VAIGAPARGDVRGRILELLARRLAIAALALVAFAGLVICTRRASGALAEPLAPGVLAGLGIVLAALAVLFRRTFAAAPRSRAAMYALWALPSAVLLVWAVGVSLAGTSAPGLVALVGTLLVEEGWSWGSLRLRADRQDALTARSTRPAAAIAVVESPAIEAERDDTVTQQLVRRQTDDGETIEGWVRVDFSARQRHAVAHVAICPPLARVPQCFAEQSDGPSAAIKVAQVLSYGVRFELKLDEPPEEPASVCVEFSIQEAAS